MRPHLIECLERAKMVSFPLAKARRIPVGNILKGVHEVTIFCICRLPNVSSRPMIECCKCLEWFHYECVGIPVDVDLPKSDPFICKQCC